MATSKDIKDQKEYNKLLDEQVAKEKEIKGVREANTNIAFSAIESLKELYGINSKNTEAEKDTLKVAKAVKNVLLDQGNNATSFNAILKDTAKRQAIVSKAQKLQSDIEAGLSKTRVGRIKGVVKLQDQILDKEREITKLEESKLGASKDKRDTANSNLVESRLELEVLDNTFNKRIGLLSTMEQELLFSKLGTQELEKSNELRDKALEKIKPASQFLEILGAIPGLSNIATKAQDELLETTKDSIKKGEEGLSTIQQIGGSLKTSFEAVTSPLALTIAGITALLRSFNQLSEAQTNFVRLTGETPRRITLINDRYLTGVDLINTQVELTNQLGVNASKVFSLNTLTAASEFTNTIGLSAEASANLARFSTINNENLNKSADALSRSVPSAFSQAQILEETANVSSDIAVSLGSSTAEIGKAVIEARKLGLSLQEVDGIAGSLLDIESSIAAEFEAEVITGKQLNLERARFFALTNDLEGLTKEIANNEELIFSFASANRIEQEAIAGALGMSRQQMADMVLKSDLLATLSEDERANAAGVTVERLKQLDAQEALATSFAQLTQSLTPIVRGLTDILNFMLRINEQIMFGVGAFKLMQFYQKASLATEIFRGKFLKKNTLQMMLQAASATIIAGFKAGIAGPIIAAGIAVAAVTGIKAALRPTSAGDAVIPAGKGPIISTQEGGLIQGTANDDIIMAPGISNIANRQRERNINSTATISESQMNKLITRLENSVAKGAEKGTSNAQIRMDLDGNALARGFDSYLAVNTRKHNT